MVKSTKWAVRSIRLTTKANGKRSTFTNRIRRTKTTFWIFLAWRNWRLRVTAVWRLRNPASKTSCLNRNYITIYISAFRCFPKQIKHWFRQSIFPEKRNPAMQNWSGWHSPVSASGTKRFWQSWGSLWTICKTLEKQSYYASEFGSISEGVLYHFYEPWKLNHSW